MNEKLSLEHRAEQGREKTEEWRFQLLLLKASACFFS